MGRGGGPSPCRGLPPCKTCPFLEIHCRAEFLSLSTLFDIASLGIASLQSVLPFPWRSSFRCLDLLQLVTFQWCGIPVVCLWLHCAKSKMCLSVSLSLSFLLVVQAAGSWGLAGWGPPFSGLVFLPSRGICPLRLCSFLPCS